MKVAFPGEELARGHGGPAASPARWAATRSPRPDRPPEGRTRGMA